MRCMIWIALIDGSQMQVFAQAKPTADIVEAMGGALINLNPPSHLQGDDAPGSSSASAFDSRRHGMTPRHDPHRSAKTAFAKEATDVLQKAYDAGDFDALAIVAPPQMLGDVRKALPDALLKILVAELDKDYLKLPVLERKAALAQLLSTGIKRAAYR